MKKSLYLSLAAAAMLGFSACDDGNYSDWASPMQNAQETITPSVTEGIVSGISEVTSLYDFATETSSVVKVFSPASTEYPTAYQVEFANGTIVNSADGTVSAETIKAVVIDLYGKRPEARALAAKVIAYTVVDGVTVKSTKDVTINAKLTAPEIFPHMYLIGAPSEWNPSCTTMPFTHSGKDVYDDPVFTVLFPVSDGDTWFAMADDKTVETGDWSNVFAAVEGNGQNLVGETGKIARRCELPALNPEAGDGSFMVHVDGDAKFIKVTLNMLEGTYLLEKVNFRPYLYFIGATDGWTNAEQKLAHQGDGLYTGFAYVADPNGWGVAFKFQQEAGNWDTQVNAGMMSSMDGVSGGDNFEVASVGVYYMEVDLSKNTMKAIKVEKMGLIGGFNDWSSDEEMTWDAENYCYVKEGASVTDAGWKFRINADWGINLGGTTDNLEANGGNLDVVGTTIKLYPTRKNSDNIYFTAE